MWQLLLLSLAAGDPNEWSTFAPGKPAAEQPAPAPAKAETINTIPEAASPRYKTAVAHIGASRFQDATVILNELTAQYPRVAEFFAARCSAQLGLKQASYAEGDCNYAIKIKPSLSMALYGLATAEDQLGKKDLAARHYREYQKDPGGRSDLKDTARARADVLMGGTGAAPAPPPPQPARRSTKPECKQGNDGRQACGYNCDLGSDGVAGCADTPDGTCTRGPDGHVTCSQLAVRGGANAGGKPPECRTGSNGVKVCGYNCQKGTNGRFYCAAMPEGECTPNPDGTFTCP